MFTPWLQQNPKSLLALMICIMIHFTRRTEQLLNNRTHDSLLDTCGQSKKVLSQRELKFPPAFCKKTRSRWPTRSGESGARFVSAGTAAKLGEFPSFARLTLVATTNQSLAVICGGTVIDRELVMTAAHCIDSTLDSIQVETGLVDLDGDLTKRQVRYGFGVCVMDDYSNDEKKGALNDVAFIQVTKPFNFDDYTQPACLELKREVRPDAVCYSIGMGLTHRGRLSRKALVLEMEPKCKAKSGADLEFETGRCWQTPSSNPTPGNPCRGDSGSPMLCIDRCEPGKTKQYVVGSVSFGPDEKCLKEKPLPVVFADTFKLAKKLMKLLQNCYESH